MCVFCISHPLSNRAFLHAVFTQRREIKRRDRERGNERFHFKQVQYIAGIVKSGIVVTFLSFVSVHMGEDCERSIRWIRMICALACIALIQHFSNFSSSSSSTTSSAFLSCHFPPDLVHQHHSHRTVRTVQSEKCVRTMKTKRQNTVCNDDWSGHEVK